MKSLIFFITPLLLLSSFSQAFALNQTSTGLLVPLFEQGRKATHEELIALLLPVAEDDSLSRLGKMREMGYLIYISGWHLSQSEKQKLFKIVHNTLDLGRKNRYLEAHLELDGATRMAITKGQARIGMSKESVRASLGKPEAIKPPAGTFMNTERWSYYSKRIELYFKDGILAALKHL